MPEPPKITMFKLLVISFIITNATFLELSLVSSNNRDFTKM